MKLLFLICFSLFVLSCSTKSTDEKQQIKKEATKVNLARTQTIQDSLDHSPQPYFKFDNVLHFSSGLNKGIAAELYDTKDSSQKQLAQFLTIVDPKIKSLKDSSILKLLKKADFKLDTISSNKHKEINYIFSKKTDAEGYDLACIAEYNDYFVFKLKNKITGIALICFGCGQDIIIGSSVSTYNFGVNEEFNKLKKLVK
jgi:hypothetical protein